MPSKDYLDDVWRKAKDHLPGWVYATLHSQAKARAGGLAAHRTEAPNLLERLSLDKVCSGDVSELEDLELIKTWTSFSKWYKSAVRKKADTTGFLKGAKVVLEELSKRGLRLKPSELLSSISKSESLLPPICPPVTRVAFVGTSPDKGEVESGHLFTGEARRVFLAKYLHPLGLEEDQVLTLTLIPEMQEEEGPPDPALIEKWLPWATSALDSCDPQVVIALGKTAKAALGERAKFVLPHPKALVRHKDSGEVGRKIKRITKYMNDLPSLDKVDNSGHNEIIIPTPIHRPQDQDALADDNSRGKQEGTREMEVQISKADSLKRIVYGVVMDPYGKSGVEPDAHKDFLPPSTIEETAHEFMQGDMVIGRQHNGKSTSHVVESSIEQYPSAEEYQKALNGEPHKVWRRPFGDDVLHSGAWVLGVKLSDADWTSFEKGDFNAFSPGGVGLRTPIDSKDMPRVSFVDLVEKSDA